EQLRCGAQANERQGLRVITIAAVDSPTAIRKTSPGFHFPLGVMAKGKLLLAFAPEDVQERVLRTPLPSFTRHTTTDPAALRAELGEIRDQGRAATRDDLQLGVGSSAAPIRDREGAVVGCASLIVRSARMDDSGVVAELLNAAEDAAHEISVALGWGPRAAA